jgi:thioredoxin-like negative regulator of GroEL
MPAKTPRQIQIESLLAESPDDEFLRYGYAMEFASIGDLESAVAHLRQLIAEKPYVPAYLQAGQLLIQLDRPEEAAELLRAGITIAREQGNDHAAGEMQSFLASIE